MSFDICGFNLQVQQNVVCLFAPAGRDVYSPTSRIWLALHRSATTYGALAGRKHISLLKERRVFKGICCYKLLAPLERKQIHLLHFQVESTECQMTHGKSFFLR
jgi:hypothetical protein